MAIINPFRLNDWPIIKFLIFVYLISIVMLILVIVGMIYDEITILRQVVGFIYLTFIPGTILLRILRIHDLNSFKTILFTVGLSLIFNMVLGMIVNFIYPLINISNPLSASSIIITWSVILILLSLLAYKVDKGYSDTATFEIRILFSPQVLFLVMLPVLAILGTQLINYYHTNILLIVLIVLIAIVPILMITNVISERLFPFAILCIALAILWHTSLISEYLTRYDLFLEYQFFNLVNENEIWDWTINVTYNAMLSVTILPTIFCKILNLSGTAIFKIIYPAIYALVPLGLYCIYRIQFSTKHAFLATFFFMSIFHFYLQMPSTCRQMIAELFYVLLLIIILEKNPGMSKKALLILFCMGLVVSHYSLAYLFIGFSIISFIILVILRKQSDYMTISFITLSLVICLTWYMYISSAEPFAAIIYVGQRILEGIKINFLSPTSRDISAIITGVSPDFLHLIYRYLWYCMIIFMAIGSVRLLAMFKRENDNAEYAAFAFCNYFLLGACVVIPFFSSTLGINRMVHLSSIILAPFCILGIETLFILLRPRRFIRFIQSYSVLLPGAVSLSALILSIFFIFTTSMPFELFNSEGVSLPLSYSHIITEDRTIPLEDKINHRMSMLTDEDVSSAQWLANHRNVDKIIYGTQWQLGIPALDSYGMIPSDKTYTLAPSTTTNDIYNDYIYMGYVNTVLGYGTTRSIGTKPDPVLGNVKYWELTAISELMEVPSKIYCNNINQIFLSTRH